MIKNIIFDFGDVFLNLDKEAVVRALATLSPKGILSELLVLNRELETGQLKAPQFLEGMCRLCPSHTENSILQVWNSMLLDFPEERLRFLEELADSEQYRLFLLSNTNALHIDYVKSMMGAKRYARFRNSFEGFYLSHEIHLAKPDRAVFEYVLRENQLKPEVTLFIDDTLENIVTATQLGMQTWHLQVGKEDITQLNTLL